MVKEQDGFEVEGFLSDFLLKGGIFVEGRNLWDKIFSLFFSSCFFFLIKVTR